MKLIVDGIIFEVQKQGGISRCSRVLLAQMCMIDPNLLIQLYMARSPKQALSLHPNIQKKRVLPLDYSGIDWLVRDKIQRRNWAFAAMLVAERNAIWHSTYYTRPPGWRGPSIVTVHDLIYYRFPEFFSREEDSALRKHIERCVHEADRVLAISATTAQDVVDLLGVRAEKIAVIHWAAEPTYQVIAESQKEKLRSGSKPFLLYVGQRTKYKNFSMLLRAYARWQARKQVDLVVVGPEWTDAERAELQALHVIDSVHLRGQVSDEELNLLYNGALAFVYPSLYEGLGVPLMEAMQAGCPIIASAIPSSQEIAQDYPVYFEPASVDSLVSALDRMWPPVEDRNRLARGQQIAAAYSWEKAARLTLEQYSNVR